MSTPVAAGASILTATVHELTAGRWFADLELDTNIAPSGAITIDFGDGVELIGTVARSDTSYGKARARAVAGADGLGATVSAKAYRQVTMGAILKDLASDTGESLDPSISSSLLSSYTQLWHRSRGSGGNALRAMVAHLGTSWRFTRDGQIWLGSDSWSELEVDGVEIDRREDEGWVLYAPHAGPTLQPGYTIDGKRVDAVVTTIREGKLRQRVFYRQSSTTTTLDRLRQGVSEIINGLLGRSYSSPAMWDHMALYPCVVDAQAGDGTLDLRPDDAVVCGSGLSGVPLKTGLPGWTVEVPSGTRVLLGFEAGDPARPFALLWEHSEDVDLLVYDGGTAAVARVGDQTSGGYLLWDAPALTLYWAPDVSGVPGVYTAVLPNPNTPNPPPPGTPGSGLSGVIVTGNNKLLA